MAFAGHDLLMIGLCMALCLTAACLVLGAEVYFFKEDSPQGFSSQDVRLTTEGALSASGWIGVVTAGLSACTIPCLVALSLEYDAVSTVVQMCNYVLMVLGIPEWILAGSNVTSIDASPQVGEALPNLVWQPRL
jgi:hypothetical protein